MPSLANVQAGLDKLGEEMDLLGASIVTQLEKQNAEINKLGAARTSTGSKLDKMSNQYSRILEDVTGLRELVAEIKATHARMSLNSGNPDGLMMAPAHWADAFLSSENYEQFKAQRQNSSRRFELKGGLDPSFRMPENMTTKDLTSAQLGALVDTFRWQQVVQDPLRPRRVPDLIPSVTVSNSDSIEYPRENVVLQLVAYLDATASSGQADLVLGVSVDKSMGIQRSKARGFYVGQVVTVSPGQPAEETGTILTIDHDTGTITLTANLANNHTVTASSAPQVTATEFVFVPEAEIKPQSEIGFELKTTAIKTLATHMTISRQMSEDSALLRGLLENRMREFLELSKERQMLFGDGSSEQLDGILSDPDIQTYSQLSGAPGDTKLDALRRSFTAVRLSFFPVDSFVVHPSDWEDIELLKGSDGQYVFNQIQTGDGIPRVWRATPVETPVIGQGRALAGSFRLGAVMWNRRQAALSMSDQHKDYRTRNLILFLIEERMAMSVLRPKAFVDVAFDGVPA